MAKKVTSTTKNGFFGGLLGVFDSPPATAVSKAKSSGRQKASTAKEEPTTKTAGPSAKPAKGKTTVTAAAAPSKKAAAATSKKGKDAVRESSATEWLPAEASPAPSIPMDSTSPQKPLANVQVVMNEHSELALQLLKDSLGELLMPLGKIGELFSKITELQDEIQNLNRQLANMRSDLDDSIEELKQSVRHKAANS